MCTMEGRGGQPNRQGSEDADSGPIPMPEMSGAGVVAKTPAPAASKSALAATERFAPGEVLAERYRVLGLIGKGGMGEVYRAEDMRFGQMVALKFLPEELARDRESLKLLIEEAKLARQISHPNICRVHDVGEVDGHVFITMEYIEGENMASLLRRVGRMPQDKGVLVAQQLCSALTTMHDRGILHHDLKPANIMLDDAGDARVTDFGLAVPTIGMRPEMAKAGTPSYMSPEQVLGKPPSTRSDLYSLGLVLYEMFTGTRLFRPKSMEELKLLHQEPIAPPSNYVPDLDHSIERVIMRCLDPDPANRPESALEVASELPGGNALTAALRLGRTPTPGAVAASGGRCMLRPMHAAGLVAAVLVLLVSCALLAGRSSMVARAALPKSPSVLVDKAEELISTLGVTAPVKDTAASLDYYEELMRLIVEHSSGDQRLAMLRRARPSPIDFWYRSSPQPLVTLASNQHVTWYDPPATHGGMVSIRLSSTGYLRELQVVPDMFASNAAPSLEPGSESERAALRERVFVVCGLVGSKLTPTPPERMPLVFSDAREAWSGVYPEAPDEPVRLEISWRGNSLATVRIVEERWSQASVQGSPLVTLAQEHAQTASYLVRAVLVIGALVLAWRHVRQRRGDRAGAWRVATLVFVLWWAGGLLRSDAVPELTGMLRMFGTTAQDAVVRALFVWLMYLALEPLVRRYWPQTLVSWARMLGQEFGDRLIARDVLVGLCVGLGMGIAVYGHQSLSSVLGGDPAPYWINQEHGIDAISSFATQVGVASELLARGILAAMASLVLLVVFRMLSRNEIVSMVAVAAIAAFVGGLWLGSGVVSFVCAGLASAAWAWTLARVGLLAVIVALSTGMFVLTFPVSPNVGAWYAGAMVLPVAMILAASGWGLRTTLARG